MNGLVNSPVVFSMRSVDWTVFGTFTYRNPLPSITKRASLLATLLDKACRETHTHFDRHFSLTRYETGEVGGRDHNHVLFANLKPGVHVTELCLRLKSYWDRIGGFARVWPYAPTLDGVGYVLKGAERYEFMTEAQSYEMTKFGIGDKVIFSNALVSRMARAGIKNNPIVDKSKHVSREIVGHGEPDRSSEHGTASAFALKQPSSCLGIDPWQASWLCTPVYS